MNEDDFIQIGKSWSIAFNSLPDEVRTIGVAMDIKTRLQQLYFERKRLKEAYDRSLSKIREHEKNLHSSLRRLGYAPSSPSRNENSP